MEKILQILKSRKLTYSSDKTPPIKVVVPGWLLLTRERANNPLFNAVWDLNALMTSQKGKKGKKGKKK
jgi:hypothetical protein